MPVITTSYISPVGELILGSFQNKLCLCDWKSRQRRKAIDQKIASTLNEPFHQGMDSLLNLSMEQLSEYFAGERKSFDIPILECGSHFQKEVWKALRDIPYGTVMSYGQLAQSMGKPNSTRAVANANAANAISIITPCHRIIGSSGKLVGYAGGMDAKKHLLKHECPDVLNFSTS